MMENASDSRQESVILIPSSESQTIIMTEDLEILMMEEVQSQTGKPVIPVAYAEQIFMEPISYG